jgi:hypothetical protein
MKLPPSQSIRMRRARTGQGHGGDGMARSGGRISWRRHRRTVSTYRGTARIAQRRREFSQRDRFGESVVLAAGGVRAAKSADLLQRDSDSRSKAAQCNKQTVNLLIWTKRQYEGSALASRWAAMSYCCLCFGPIPTVGCQVHCFWRTIRLRQLKPARGHSCTEVRRNVLCKGPRRI